VQLQSTAVPCIVCCGASPQEEAIRAQTRSVIEIIRDILRAEGAVSPKVVDAAASSLASATEWQLA